MTFLAALRCDRIDAPCGLDQPINTQSFTDYVEQCLVPTVSPGDVVIMDNLSSHKKPAIRSAISAVGARLLFLPPYSPDLNPIEQVFAKSTSPTTGQQEFLAHLLKAMLCNLHTILTDIGVHFAKQPRNRNIV